MEENSANSHVMRTPFPWSWGVLYFWPWPLFAAVVGALIQSPGNYKAADVVCGSRSMRTQTSDQLYRGAAQQLSLTSSSSPRFPLMAGLDWLEEGGSGPSPHYSRCAGVLDASVPPLPWHGEDRGQWPQPPRSSYELRWRSCRKALLLRISRPEWQMESRSGRGISSASKCFICFSSQEGGCRHTFDDGTRQA